MCAKPVFPIKSAPALGYWSRRVLMTAPPTDDGDHSKEASQDARMTRDHRRTGSPGNLADVDREEE